jgi:3-deoxy-7-phosphoheptulonate synthase
VRVGAAEFGGDRFTIVGGPCAVESAEQIARCAALNAELGVGMLRGGCFKPRTSPYSFAGLGVEGLKLLAAAGARHGIPVVTEVGSSEEIELATPYADMFQIGSRNMSNFNLLRLVGRAGRPVLLKRGMSATIDEFLLAAEHLMAAGNDQIVLCERGIRTFETSTRATLDISAVPVLRERTHLPIIVDPSHAAGVRSLVTPLARAAKAVGAHGLLVEYHPDPDRALSDGLQSLSCPQFESLVLELR